MNHTDHVALLRGGIESIGGVWADFGSGTGAFTLALADLIGPAGVIYSIDQDRFALAQQERSMLARFLNTIVHYRPADFTRPIELPPLDGIVMANSLHFQRHKEPIVKLLKGYLRIYGRFILVEYNIEQGNSAVPYPVSYRQWEELAQRCGFTHTRLLKTRPSRFLKEIYSAVSWVQKD
ncbi:MAG: methyltransferase domain-containing protein [Chloroflexi bacterium]|nr:methyltransferase domain-containing protein [Chloroflexota bacterium]